MILLLLLIPFCIAFFYGLIRGFIAAHENNKAPPPETDSSPENGDTIELLDNQIESLTALIKHLDSVYNTATSEKEKATALRQLITAQDKLIKTLQKKDSL